MLFPVPSPTRIFERDGKCDGERRCSHPVTSQQVKIITNLPAMAELLKQPSKYWLVNFLEFRKITYLFRSILVVVFFFFFPSQKYYYGAQSSLLHDSICQCRDLSSNRCNSLINIQIGIVHTHLMVKIPLGSKHRFKITCQWLFYF